MIINVLTLFPEMFAPVITSSMLGKAVEKGILEIRIIDIRDFSKDKHHKADDTPFGGGAGMVLLAQPVFDALKAKEACGKPLIHLSPRGKIINKNFLEELAQEEEIFLLCGHYEGIDQRIIDYWEIEEVSIGDYILTGGELPAMVLIDSLSRFIPQVLGCSDSVCDESIYSGLLEYPQYTKPREYLDLKVPEVLLNGNHKLIELWKLEQSLRLTKQRRPDLFEIFLAEKSSSLSKDEKKLLERIQNEP
ncbi:MAG: tRNA (guanosine(37)-N1)-methyltransferase TrmD [Anaerovoracaceae bacterium]|jgi:tRNA (guanine37-N1)-methyltransferase|nr:tRNA (guanosine(37)-N1)-methyltransferase TrmD [Anaerovoracaceae bacterium]